MKQNLELSVNKILREEKISSLSDNELAGLKVAEKKIYLNELPKDELAANIGLKNFTVAHELGHWVLHRNLIRENSRHIC